MLSNSSDTTNHYFELARQFVNNTSRNIFLTGKAGTGKTTFLKYIRENSYKKMAVVAPTGVAAMNAGGVTIHSFFQLPFGPFVPDSSNGFELAERGFVNQQTIFRHIRLGNSKRKLFEELELLIIDEVSMVRADMLDAVDTVLRHMRRQRGLPFGGVQVLFIGDLFQLPPVVQDEEWRVLKQHYSSPFFFDSKVLQQDPPLYIELKKIYRQNDASFIQVLNNIRNNQLNQDDLQLLNRYYQPGFKPEGKGEYITLTTHNSKADAINQNELKKLPGKLHSFRAVIQGDFNEKALPADEVLYLKEGAQIMFIKNDKGEERRYYNGKIGTISRIEEESIYVVFPDTTEEMLVELEIWKNIRYKYEQDADKIDEDETGTFSQYPIRLAWAITIHKSQGLTFDKAIIDAGESFAPGQVYVALSRLTSLDGLILYSPIRPDSIYTDDRASGVSRKEQPLDSLQHQLKQEQKLFLNHHLLQLFDWSKLTNELKTFVQDFEHRKIPLQEEAKKLADGLLHKANELQATAHKFIRQLEQMLPAAEQDHFRQAHQRIEAASGYFLNALHQELFTPLQKHFEDMKYRAKTKKYLKELHSLNAEILRRKNQLEQAIQIIITLSQGSEAHSVMEQLVSGKPAISAGNKETGKPVKVKKTKAEKGESHRISLQFFKEGKSIQEIAEARSMALSTIEGHLVSFIPTGEVDITALVSPERITTIQKVIEGLGEVISSAQIKEKLDSSYSYGEIRAVLSHMKRSQETSNA